MIIWPESSSLSRRIQIQDGEFAFVRCTAIGTNGFALAIENVPFLVTIIVLAWLDEINGFYKGALPFIGCRALRRIMQPVNKSPVEERYGIF